MRLPNSSLIVVFNTNDNSIYFYDKSNLLLVAWLDIDSKIFAIDIFKFGCIVDRFNNDTNTKIRYEILSINSNEVVIKCCNLYRKTFKVRFD